MCKTFEIYWSDLTEECQEELIKCGFDDKNIIDCVFPLTVIFIDDETDDQN